MIIFLFINVDINFGMIIFSVSSLIKFSLINIYIYQNEWKKEDIVERGVGFLLHLILVYYYLKVINWFFILALKMQKYKEETEMFANVFDEGVMILSDRNK